MTVFLIFLTIICVAGMGSCTLGTKFTKTDYTPVSMFILAFYFIFMIYYFTVCLK